MPNSISPRVLAIIHNPKLPSEKGRKLNQVLGWNDPDSLAQQYIRDVAESTYAYAQYRIVERVEVDDFPVKLDGFKYTPDTYLKSWRSKTGFHQRDAVDYRALLAQFEVVRKINENLIDEVWLFGFPYAGYYESIMVGPESFWCNAPPLEGVPANRRFVVMGFNYERGVGEMLEDLGHRAESILTKVYEHMTGDANLWERFTRYDKTHPGRAECGNVHFAPNSGQDYDWGSYRPVISKCHDWLSFPKLRGITRNVNCSEWGNGDIRLHHMWWFRHFPHVDGETGGISNNWWQYVIDPNNVTL